MTVFTGLAKIKTEGEIIAYDDPLEIIRYAIEATKKLKRNKRVARQLENALRIAYQELRKK